MIKHDRFIGLLILTLLFMTLTACSGTFGMNTSEATAVHVSEFKHFGSINQEESISFTDEEEIEVFVGAFNSATEETGAVDMPEGDYDVQIIFEDGDTKDFHLWIEDVGAGQGTIMSTEDTHKIYTLSRSNTESLKELLDFN